MSGYCIFRRAGDPPEDAVFVKEGFSASAAVFNAFWALWHRMWVIAALLFAAFTCLSIAAALGSSESNAVMIIQAAAALLLGMEGHRLREWSLRKSGYAEVGFVQAGSQEEAELKFFLAERQPGMSVPDTVYRPMAASQSDPLGLFGNV